MFSQGASFLLCTGGGGGCVAKGGMHGRVACMVVGGGCAWPGEAIHGGGHV